MNVGARLVRLERRLPRPVDMSPAHRRINRILCNIGIHQYPDLVLVERRDCAPGEKGLCCFLRIRKEVLWSQGHEDEAVRLHIEIKRREAKWRKKIDPKRVFEGVHEQVEEDSALTKEAIRRALERLGRQPTLPGQRLTAEPARSTP